MIYIWCTFSETFINICSFFTELWPLIYSIVSYLNIIFQYLKIKKIHFVGTKITKKTLSFLCLLSLKISAAYIQISMSYCPWVVSQNCTKFIHFKVNNVYFVYNQRTHTKKKRYLLTVYTPWKFHHYIFKNFRVKAPALYHYHTSAYTTRVICHRFYPNFFQKLF